MTKERGRSGQRLRDLRYNHLCISAGCSLVGWRTFQVTSLMASEHENETWIFKGSPAPGQIMRRPHDADHGMDVGGRRLGDAGNGKGEGQVGGEDGGKRGWRGKVMRCHRAGLPLARPLSP